VLRFVSCPRSDRIAVSFAIVLAIALLSAGVSPLRGQQFAYSSSGGTIDYDPADGIGATTASFRIEELPGPSAPHLVTGFAMSVAHDPGLATAASIAQGSRIAALNGGAGPDFFDPEILVGGITVASLFSFVGAASATFETPEEVIAVGYEAVPATWTGDSDGGSAALAWTPLGTPATQNVAIVAGASIPASGVPSELVFVPVAIPDPTWLRGDANGDGAVVPIADAITILSQLFTGGAPSACLDAADVNGDGASDIADPIGLLAYGFSGGPPPPPPFPDCDLAPAALGCDLAVCP